MWQISPKSLTLDIPEIHLWRTNLDEDSGELEQLQTILSPDEKSRADKFYFPQHRQRFIVARAVLRRILGRYLNVAPQKLEFAYSSRGKPKLGGIFAKSDIQFNLSHCQEIALYGITRQHSIGVDVEYLRPLDNLTQIAARFYTPEEFAIINNLPGEQQRIAFFRGWTAKEAYLKATGEGLSGGLEKVEVSLSPDEPLRLLRLPENIGAWSLFPVDIHPDYRAAVAIATRNCQLRYWQTYATISDQ